MKMLSAIMVLLLSFEATANNMFIPNYYRNRREVNQYSAIGWSQRREAGVMVTNTTTDTQLGGIDTEESDTQLIRPHLYYRFEGGANVEFEYSLQKTDEKDLSNGIEDENKIKAPVINVGYELPTVPVAIGVTFSDAEYSFKDGTSGLTMDSDVSTMAIGGGYRLENQVYLGAGITQMKIDNIAGSTNLEIFNLGVGKVYGDHENPQASVEAILFLANEAGSKLYQLEVRGLRNINALQLYGTISYGIVNGTTVDGRDYSVTAGLDYQLGDFYVGPQVTFENDDADDEEETNLEASFQAGYRTRHLEFYARYEFGDSETDLLVPPPTTNFKRDLSGLSFAGIYKF